MSYFDLDFKIQKIIEKIGKTGEYFWERGWAGGNAGNISIKLENFTLKGSKVTCAGKTFNTPYPYVAGDYYLVTASGRRMRDILDNPEENLCIVKINEKGSGYEIAWGCRVGKFPTSEFDAHLRAYNIRKKMEKPVTVVIHTQPLDMIALSMLTEYQSTRRFSELIWKMQPETINNIPEGIAFLPYEVPGSMELAKATEEAFKKGYRIALWANHGVIAAGRDIDEVLDLIDYANSSTVIALKLMQAGYNPGTLGLKREDLIKLCKISGLKSSPFYLED